MVRFLPGFHTKTCIEQFIFEHFIHAAGDGFIHEPVVSQFEICSYNSPDGDACLHLHSATLTSTFISRRHLQLVAGDALVSVA